jgi:TPR repeat protein
MMRATRFDADVHAMSDKHRFLHTCALLYLWLGLIYTTTASADDYELGRQALELGHSAQAIELWRPLAEAGDADAQFGLGIIYNDAVGVEQDYAEANYWFLRAAEQGYGMAQFNLGNAYKNGTGMAVDPAMAVIWWRKAAEQDFAPAQFNLGSAHLEGFGTPRDRAAGLSWYRRAAANGHPQAQRNLEMHKDTAPTTDASPNPRHTVPPMTATAPIDTPATAGNSAKPPSTPPDKTVVNRPTPAATAQSAGCNAWLDQDASTHTVQLMANQTENDLHAYIAQHALTDTAICSYPIKGTRWYALLYGRYGSADDARTALEALPGKVRTGGGYVRRISTIRHATAEP